MKRFDDVRAVVSSALQRGRRTFQSIAQELDCGPSAGSRYLRMALAEVSDGARSNAEIWAKDGTFIVVPLPEDGERGARNQQLAASLAAR